MRIQTIIVWILGLLCPQLHQAQNAPQASGKHSIYFAPTSYALQEKAQLDLFYLKRELGQIVDDYYLEIHAHTDNVGSLEDNKILSQNRAQAVADYLISKGLEASLIKRFTYGEEQPKANNGSALGRQENRRVDVLVYIPHQQISQNTPTKENRTAKNEEKEQVYIDKYRLEVLSKAEEALEEDVQIFDLDPKSDTLIVGKHGTAIFIPANTFEPSIDENKITILLNEIYKKSEMVLTNFTTTSHGKILASGGMVKIQAIDGGKEYSKPLNKDISYFFPTAGMHTDMDLFFGHRNQNGDINWQLSGRSIKDYDSYLDQVEKDDYTSNYVDNLGLNRRQRVIYPESNVICINQAMTSLMGPSPDPLCGTLTCPLFWCKIEKTFRPAAFKARQSAQFQQCLKNFINDNGLENSLTEEDLYDLSNEVQKRFGNSPSTMRKALERKKQEIFERAFDEGKISLEAMNFYVFSSRGLGSINCDRFVNPEAPLITMKFRFPKQEKGLKVDSKLVMKNVQGVLSSQINSQTGEVLFELVPKGSDAVLVAIDYSHKHPRLAMQKIKVGETQPQLKFVQYKDAKALKEALKVLDI